MGTRRFHANRPYDRMILMGLKGEVVRLAATQGGYITRQQLIESGLSGSAADRLVNTGEIAVVAHSVYRVWTSDSHDDLLRGACLALSWAVASHESAALLLGFAPMVWTRVTVTVPSHTTHRFPGVVVRRCDDLKRDDVIVKDAIPVTTVARTVFDLAGVLPFRHFDSIAEALLLDGRLELPHLIHQLESLGRRGKRGTRAVRDFIALRSELPPASSKLEVRGRRLIKSGDLPLPVHEFPIPWSPTRRFDDAYPAAHIAIEWDSRAWHSQRKAMTADRRRDRSAALHGWVVLRFTWEDVTRNPSEVLATIRKLLLERQTLGS